MSLEATGSQTVGPFFRMGLDALNNDNLAPAGVAGARISVRGQVVDGDGTPVPDAMIEIWQANHLGRYAHPEDQRDIAIEPVFKGFGRVPTDAQGRFVFTTIKPGAVPAGDGGMQAPHIVLLIFMRGLLKNLITRIYFPEDNPGTEDPLLASVPSDRRNTLIGTREGAQNVIFNVVLQGPHETVFFDY